MENTIQNGAARRLYKSRRNKIIDGVCGGVAEYFEVDPTIVRLLWVLITLIGGTGFILYIIAMIIMPVNPEFKINGNSTSNASALSQDKKRFWGVLLILLGALILISNLGWFAAFRWWHLSWSTVFPIILIILGGWLIYIHMNKRSTSTESAVQENNTFTQPVRKELRRSKIEKKLFGVCGGLAKYFDIDPTVVRIIFVILVLASFGWGLLIYIILAILMPEEKFPFTTTTGK